jgi:hypothetical protein
VTATAENISDETLGLIAEPVAAAQVQPASFYQFAFPVSGHSSTRLNAVLGACASFRLIAG